ncbi:MAG: hypothetical protein WDM92_16625 [Caulobacteraceae bacterium]
MADAPILTPVQDEAYAILCKALNFQPPLCTPTWELPWIRVVEGVCAIERRFGVSIDADEAFGLRQLDAVSLIDVLALVEARVPSCLRPREAAPPPEPRTWRRSAQVYDFAAYAHAVREARALKGARA